MRYEAENALRGERAPSSARSSDVPLHTSKLDHIYNYSDRRRARMGARHRADRRGPAARRLHAPGRQPRHLLLRLPQRHEVDQPQDRRGRAPAGPSFHSGGATLDHEDPRVVYLSRTIGHWNQVEQWFTPDTGRTWSHRQLTTDPNGYAIRPVTPARARPAPTGSSTSGATSARSASPTTRRASTRSTSRRRREGGAPPTSGGCPQHRGRGRRGGRRRAVAAQLDVRDAERQQAVRAVGEGARDLGRRRAGEVGLDEHDVRAAHERAQAVGVERPHVAR